MIWDRRRLRYEGRPIEGQVADLVARTGQDEILVLSHDLPGATAGRGPAILLQRFSGAVRSDETYSIYRWPARP